MFFRVKQIVEDVTQDQPILLEKEASMILSRGGIGYVSAELNEDGSAKDNGVVEVGLLPTAVIVDPQADFIVSIMEMMHPFPGTTIYVQDNVDVSEYEDGPSPDLMELLFGTEKDA